MTFNRGALHCDECPEHFESDEKKFDAVMAEAKAKGWRSFKGPDGEWAHACPACVEQFAKGKSSR